MSSEEKSVIAVTIAAVLVFAAAFMPWEEIRWTPQPVKWTLKQPYPFRDVPMESTPREVTTTVSGWKGHATLGGLKLPDWLVVLAAASVAVLCWLKLASVWDSPSALLLVMAGYGLVHAALVLAPLASSEGRSGGVGLFVTAAAFLGMLLVLLQQARRPDEASPPDPPPEQTGPA